MWIRCDAPYAQADAASGRWNRRSLGGPRASDTTSRRATGCRRVVRMSPVPASRVPIQVSRSAATRRQTNWTPWFVPRPSFIRDESARCSADPECQRPDAPGRAGAPIGRDDRERRGCAVGDRPQPEAIEPKTRVDGVVAEAAERRATVRGDRAVRQCPKPVVLDGTRTRDPLLLIDRGDVHQRGTPPRSGRGHATDPACSCPWAA